MIRWMVAALILLPLLDSSVHAQAQLTGRTITPECVVPRDVTVTPDDRKALITFDGGGLNVAAEKPANVSIYDIELYRRTSGNSPTGAASGSLVVKRLVSVDNRRDLQPLENGVVYFARVRARDRWGNATDWVQSANFVPNANRVNALRKRCTAFFDDFNDDAAGLDLNTEKWSFGYNLGVQPDVSHSFVNDQAHAHNMTATRIWDRGMVINRPLAKLWHREGGEENSIFVDVDGAAGYRHFWYLDLFPEPLDCYPLIDAFKANASFLDRGIRFSMGGNSIAVFEIRGAKRAPIKLGEVDISHGKHRRSANVRQPWEFRIRRDRVQVFVNDVLRISVPVHIKWDASYVHWVNFSYNTAKASVPTMLLHWDNFGMTGPEPETVLHNYYTELRLGREMIDPEDRRTKLNSPITDTIPIPDSIANAVAARLFVTFDNKHYYATSYKLNPQNAIVVNGTPIPVNPSDDDFRGVVVPIPPSVLRQGENKITYRLNNAYVINPHIEVELPRQSEGVSSPASAFSTPCEIWKNCQTIAPPSVGADCIIESIESRSGRAGDLWNGNTQISGMTNIQVLVRQGGPMESGGNPAPWDRMELLIDGKVALTESIAPGVGVGVGRYTIALDSSKLSRGQHRLFVRTVSVRGLLSTPNYFEKFGKMGDSEGYEIKVRVIN